MVFWGTIIFAFTYNSKQITSLYLSKSNKNIITHYIEVFALPANQIYNNNFLRLLASDNTATLIYAMFPVTVTQ